MVFVTKFQRTLSNLVILIAAEQILNRSCAHKQKWEGAEKLLGRFGSQPKALLGSPLVSNRKLRSGTNVT